jgi:dihydropteroate synthase
MFTLKSGSRLLPIERPLIMGVINLTPDSFYKNSRAINQSDYIERIDQMVAQGVDIIDLGGQSSRPGAELINEEDEFKRIEGALEYTISKYPGIWVSVDTFHAAVAKKSLKKGAHIINDISAGEFDKRMLFTVAEFNACYVCMHMQGTPQKMQLKPSYLDVTTEVLDFFKGKIQQCLSAGIGSLIIDPGFGFGKSIEHNYKLANDLEMFVLMGWPVLTGFSRKSMIYKLLDFTPDQSLNGTTVLNTISIMKGASILRVHDVLEAAECVKITSAVKGLFAK